MIGGEEVKGRKNSPVRSPKKSYYKHLTDLQSQILAGYGVVYDDKNPKQWSKSSKMVPCSF